jgi:hypothetical protein
MNVSPTVSDCHGRNGLLSRFDWFRRRTELWATTLGPVADVGHESRWEIDSRTSKKKLESWRRLK